MIWIVPVAASILAFTVGFVIALFIANWPRAETPFPPFDLEAFRAKTREAEEAMNTEETTYTTTSWDNSVGGDANE